MLTNSFSSYSRLCGSCLRMRASYRYRSIVLLNFVTIFSFRKHIVALEFQHRIIFSLHVLAISPSILGKGQSEGWEPILWRIYTPDLFSSLQSTDPPNHRISSCCDFKHSSYGRLNFCRGGMFGRLLLLLPSSRNYWLQILHWFGLLLNHYLSPAILDILVDSYLSAI